MRYGLLCHECNDWILSNAEENDTKKVFSEHKNKFPNHTILVLQKETIWEQSSKLGCPMLRDYCGNWVAIKEDPCPTKACGMRGCHNYGLYFDKQDRLKLIPFIDSYDFVSDNISHSPPDATISKVAEVK